MSFKPGNLEATDRQLRDMSAYIQPPSATKYIISGLKIPSCVDRNFHFKKQILAPQSGAV
jgi:hypothetical protein